MKKSLHFLFILCVVLMTISFSSCKKDSCDNTKYLYWNEGGEVLAKCGDVTLTEQEFQNALLTMPETRRKMFDNPQRKGDFVKRLLELKLSSLKALEKNCQEREDFKEKEKQLEIIHEIQTKVALQDTLLTQEVVERIIVTDKEAEEYYKNRYPFWNKREVSEIFFSLPPNPTDKQIREKRVLAEEIYTKLENGQLSWNDAVQKFSDSSKAVKERNGSRGEVHRQSRKFGKDIITKIFEIEKEGDITEPLSDKRGFFIVKLDKTLGFEEQRENIKEVIKSQRVRKEREEYLDSLKTSPIEFSIEGYDPNSSFERSRIPKNN